MSPPGSVPLTLRRFGDRIISRRSAIEWPPHSPDLNPLDYSFWGQVQAELDLAEFDREDPMSKSDMMALVNDFIANFDEAKVRKITQNIRKRARLKFKFSEITSIFITV